MDHPVLPTFPKHWCYFQGPDDKMCLTLVGFHRAVPAFLV